MADLDKIELGKRGEDLCAEFLKTRGWKILERNLNSPFGEVDIICERQGCLWAVEVKTRSRVQAEWLPGIVSPRQKQRIARSLTWYAREYAQLSHQFLEIYLALVNMRSPSIQLFQLIPS